MPVAVLEEELSFEEFLGWCEFWRWKREQEDAAMEKARRQR
jgi:hypothetical protein